MTDRTCYRDERGGVCPHEPHEHCPNEFIKPCENQCELCKEETINREVAPITDKMTIQEAITELEKCYLIQSDDEGRRRNKAVTMAIESLSHKRIPPFCLEEIILLNQELNRLYDENEKLKDKLHEIHCITRDEILPTLNKEETK